MWKFCLGVCFVLLTEFNLISGMFSTINSATLYRIEVPAGTGAASVIPKLCFENCSHSGVKSWTYSPPQQMQMYCCDFESALHSVQLFFIYKGWRGVWMRSLSGRNKDVSREKKRSCDASVSLFSCLIYIYTFIQTPAPSTLV